MDALTGHPSASSSIETGLSCFFTFSGLLGSNCCQDFSKTMEKFGLTSCFLVWLGSGYAELV